MIPKLVSLAQEIDLDRRENLVLSSRAYGRVLLSLPAQRVLDAHRQPREHQARCPERPRGQRQGREGARRRSRTRARSSTCSTAPAARNAKVTNIADALTARGMNAMVPPIAEGRADNDDYKDTVITIYNGAAATCR